MAGNTRYKKRGINAKLIIFLILLVLIMGCVLFLVTRKITKLTFEGNKNCTEEQMEKYLFQDKLDDNPFVFWFQSKFREHKTIPFVEEYQVSMVSLTEFKIHVYEKSIVGYLTYMGQCMYFDKDGIVVEVTSKELDGIAKVQGIEFDHIVMNTKIPVEDKNTFDTILDITQLISNYQVPVDYIEINKDLEIMLHIDKVRVELGRDDETLSQKVNDLSSIISVLENTDGVLDMTEYIKNENGYTFKRD